MISAEDFDTLRSIARARQDHAAIKELLGPTQWIIDEDNTEHGYIYVLVPDETVKVYQHLMLGYDNPDRPPYSSLTVAIFPAKSEHLEEFNAAFHSAAETISQYVGAPTTGGERKLSFRTWTYAYYRWSLPEGEFALVQDEFDVQVGMDITLRIELVGTPINETLSLR
jgi:hypothetical protein